MESSLNGAAREGWTPGPWRTGDADWRTIVGSVTRWKSYTLPNGCVGASNACVAEIDKSNNEAEDLANARLIAAAPELYAALEAFVSHHDNYDDERPVDYSQLIASARLALTRARGSAQA